MKIYILDENSKNVARMVTWLSQDVRITDVKVSDDYIDFLEKIAGSPPELCIIRLGSHRIPGLKAAEMIQQSHPYTKIVFVSDDRDYALDAFEIGAFGYLLCPITKDKLDKFLREVI